MDLIQDGDSWMDMIKDRHRTNHIYNKATADMIAKNITKRFFLLYVAFCETMEKLAHES